MDIFKNLSDKDLAALLDATGARTRIVRKDMNLSQAIPDSQVEMIATDVFMAAQGVNFGTNDETVTVDNKNLDIDELVKLNKSLRKHYGDLIDTTAAYLTNKNSQLFITELTAFYNSDMHLLGL